MSLDYACECRAEHIGSCKYAPARVRCTGCNWDVAPQDIVWSETRNGETFTLCADCGAEPFEED